jgi:hypothetical protein
VGSDLLAVAIEQRDDCHCGCWYLKRACLPELVVPYEWNPLLDEVTDDRDRTLWDGNGSLSRFALLSACCVCGREEAAFLSFWRGIPFCGNARTGSAKLCANEGS